MFTINAYETLSHNAALAVCKAQANGNLATIRNSLERDLFLEWGQKSGVVRFWVASKPSCSFICNIWWCPGWRCGAFNWENLASLPFEGGVSNFWCGGYPVYGTSSTCESCSVFLDIQSNCLKNDDNFWNHYICEIGRLLNKIENLLNKLN